LAGFEVIIVGRFSSDHRGQQRIGEIATGTYIEPTNRKITVDELYSALLDDYKNNELASYEGAQQRWQRTAKDGEPMPEAGRLKKHFSGIRALAVTTDMLNKYVATCREQGLSNATCNRDLAALRRAFKLAYRAGKIQKCPNFPHLKEAAPRSGFVEEPEYNSLAKNAAELWLRALLATAYTFGFREGELIPTKRAQAQSGPARQTSGLDEPHNSPERGRNEEWRWSAGETD